MLSNTVRLIREDTHKKEVFLEVGPLRFYPPYTNGSVVHATSGFLLSGQGGFTLPTPLIFPKPLPFSSVQTHKLTAGIHETCNKGKK